MLKDEDVNPEEEEEEDLFEGDVTDPLLGDMMLLPSPFIIKEALIPPRPPFLRCVADEPPPPAQEEDE